MTRLDDQLLRGIDWDNLDIDEVAANSFKDFHAKGFDYLCLARTPLLTIKAYFFAEGLASQKVGEVINPHDHRYDFLTQCYSGTIRNKWYADANPRNESCLTGFQEWNWDTPLNGGSGFSWKGTRFLETKKQQDFTPGAKYFMRADELHTIEVMAPETCIVLFQYEDVVPLGQPTSTYTLEFEPPSLKGLYSEMSSDYAINRIELLKELTGKL